MLTKRIVIPFFLLLTSIGLAVFGLSLPAGDTVRTLVFVCAGIDFVVALGFFLFGGLR